MGVGNFVTEIQSIIFSHFKNKKYEKEYKNQKRGRKL